MKLTKHHTLTVVLEGDNEILQFYDLLCLGKHTWKETDGRQHLAAKLVELYLEAE